MYFFKKEGKQYLDLTGDLILSSNDRLIKARSKSAAPVKALNAKFVLNCGDLNLMGKLKATILVLRFVWGKPQPLTAADTNKREPVKNKEPAPPTYCSNCHGPMGDTPYRNICNRCGNADIPLEKPVAATPRDWVEDFPHENGNYENKCCHCGHSFIGHKRRVVCKVCDNE